MRKSFLFFLSIAFMNSIVCPNTSASNVFGATLSDNGWSCSYRGVENARYVGRGKITRWNCVKGDRKIDDSNEAANQCAIFDTRQQMNSHNKIRINHMADCREKMISFKDSSSDSKRIWKSAGWFKMRVSGKWSEFSESKLKEICNDAIISDSDSLYIATCPSLTSQNFEAMLQVEGKTSKDDAFIDSGNDDGKDLNEDNKKAYNDVRSPWFANSWIILSMLILSLLISFFAFSLFKRKKK